MKRWIPFAMLLVAALISAVYLVLTGQTRSYRPGNPDPAVIYQEACAECHGKQGEGRGWFYPALGEKEISREDVAEIVRDGAFMMPAFPQIPDTTLLRLSSYIWEKRFRESESPEKSR
jgi:mono/diheme cytochrome c family protein